MAPEQNAGGSPDRIVAIDWSGRVDAAGQRRHIWAAVWTHAAVARRGRGASAAPPPVRSPLNGFIALTAGRTREETADWLLSLARETPRMVVGFDFCFSFPVWFVRGELRCNTVEEFWQLVEATHGERWLMRRDATDPAHDPRFWGKPHKRPAEFSGERLHRMLRATDIDCKILSHIPEAERAARVKGITPKSVFQIGGSGSVGTASLRGMPILRMLKAGGFRVWPFDAIGLAEQPPAPLVVEMYTRLMTGPVHKANPAKRAEYLRRRQDPDASEFDARYLALPRAVLAKARASEDAFDALVACLVMAGRRDAFPDLPQPQDPAARIEGWTWAPEL